MKMNDDAVIVEIGAIATVIICFMTAITFMYTIGVWEQEFWISDLDGASIIGYDGNWGEDIIVTYQDDSIESVKSISNNYWSSMAIKNEGSKAITTVTYCLNAKLPIDHTFNILDYYCNIYIIQNGIEIYRTLYTKTDSIDIEANEWTRFITTSLDVQTICSNLTDGSYTICFENIGVIEGITVPDGLTFDVVTENGLVKFLI